jgi:hypothetical protein
VGLRLRSFGANHGRGSAELIGKCGALLDNGSESQGEDSRDSEDDDTSNIEINVTQAAVPGTEAFIAGTIEARDVDTPTSPGLEADMVDSTRENFLVFLMGFAKASSMFEGYFEPNLAFDTVTLDESVFFFATTLALLPAAFPEVTSFLFLEASVLALVPGCGHEAYVISTFSKNQLRRPLLGSD